MKKKLLLLATVLLTNLLTGCSPASEKKDPNHYLDEPMPIWPRGDITSFDGEISNINTNQGLALYFYSNGYTWFKFKPLYDGYYHFLLESTEANEQSLPLYIEFFDRYVDGKTDEGLISQHTGNYARKDLLGGAYAYKKLYANQKIYIRVRSNNYRSARSASFSVHDRFNPNTMVHYHDYTDYYEKISDNEYKAFCYCGEYIIETIE